MNIHVPTDLSQSAGSARKGELDHQTELALARAWRDRGDRRPVTGSSSRIGVWPSGPWRVGRQGGGGA